MRRALLLRGHSTQGAYTHLTDETNQPEPQSEDPIPAAAEETHAADPPAEMTADARRRPTNRLIAIVEEPAPEPEADARAEPMPPRPHPSRGRAEAAEPRPSPSPSRSRWPPRPHPRPRQPPSRRPLPSPSRAGRGRGRARARARVRLRADDHGAAPGRPVERGQEPQARRRGRGHRGPHRPRRDPGRLRRQERGRRLQPRADEPSRPARRRRGTARS